MQLYGGLGSASLCIVYKTCRHWPCVAPENNKLAKLRRHASRVHFPSNSPTHSVLEQFRLYMLGFGNVSRHVGHLVHFHIGHYVQLHVGHFFIVSKIDKIEIQKYYGLTD